MTLRRKVGSSRSVLASSSVPGRTRCAAGAMKSSGSSDCATVTSWHRDCQDVANKPGRGRISAQLCTVDRVVHAQALHALWHSLRGMTEFRRLLELRAV